MLRLLSKRDKLEQELDAALNVVSTTELNIVAARKRFGILLIRYKKWLAENNFEGMKYSKDSSPPWPVKS